MIISSYWYFKNDSKEDKSKSTIASFLAGSNLILALRINLCEFLWKFDVTELINVQVLDS